MANISEVKNFLSVPTPDLWVEAALSNLPILLIDHAQCEKKAAATAMKFMHRYSENTTIAQAMSRLAREELRHFEQVLTLMANRNIPFINLSPSRYAGHLHENIEKTEPFKVVDSLIVGAFIEARSCERFAALAPYLLDEELKKYYLFLLRSEARHFLTYLQLARTLLANEQRFNQRISFFRALEEELICSPDSEFRFHSGVPQ